MDSFIELFGKEIPLYGIFYYLGIAIAGVVAVLLCKKKNIERYDFVYSAVYSLIGATIGAKLLFIVVSIEEIIELQLSLEAIIKGGFVFYGGLIGGILGLLIYVKEFKLKFLPFADLYATVLPLGHAFGRIGCFFAGCCYGIPYDGPFSYTYHYSIGTTPTEIPLLPIQLIEAITLFWIFIITLIIFQKNFSCGTVTTVYIFSYSIIRFVLEFFRGDKERGAFLSLSTAQWISIALILLVTIYFLYRLKNNPTTANIKNQITD